VARCLEASLARSTRSLAVSTFNNSWLPHCLAISPPVDPFQPDEATLAFFVASKVGTLKIKTIKRYLASVATICQENGYPHPLAGSVRLERMLRGAKRVFGDGARRRRLPLTTGLLARLQPHFDMRLRSERMCWAAITTGVYGLLRGGEFTTNSRSASRFLRQSSLSWHDDTHAFLHLDASKTDPFRHGVDIHILANGTGTCPIAALRAMQRLTPAAPDSPLFMNNDHTPLTRAALVQRVRLAVQAAGMDASAYSGHSFRRGGAQSLAEAHVPDHAIQAMGRWHSWSYKLYLGITPSQLAHHSAAMGALPVASELPVLDLSL
jgi:hypothetical protein